MTTNDLSCLDGVIGLARCACPCLSATAPVGYAAATSKLYIDDLLPLDMAGAGPDCESPTNPWNVLARGRTIGGTMFLNDYRNGLTKNTQSKRANFRGQIGEDVARGVLPLTGVYAGVHIPTVNMKGGYLHISKVGGVFDQTGTITARIYDQSNKTHGSPIVINTVGSPSGTLVEVAVDISLPLWTSSGQMAQYWLVYPVNQANLPRPIRVWCPCNGSPIPVYSTDAPYWKNTNSRQAWTNWMQMGDWQGSSVTDFDLEAQKSLSSFSGYTNGLTLTIELTCDPVNVICMEAFDYSDPATMAAAVAYHYAAAISTAELIMMNIEPFRNSGVTAEILSAAIPAWRTRYEENLEYAKYNADLSQTDCLFCKPAFSMSIKGKTP